jgi:hypothetical protein
MIANHIAVLVSDLQRAVDELPSFCQIHDREEHEADGMLEQYVIVEEAGASLLLVQPLGEGPYAAALAKRGPGLHHIGCVTALLDESISECTDKGLLLHPRSLKTYPRGTVWLCRPGVPFLVELMHWPDHAPLRDCRIQLPGGVALPDVARNLIDNVSFLTGEDASLGVTMGERDVAIGLD